MLTVTETNLADGENQRMVPVYASESDLMDGRYGGCIECGHVQYGCEPDARKYDCENCDELAVYGLEELLIMGNLIIE